MLSEGAGRGRLQGRWLQRRERVGAERTGARRERETREGVVLSTSSTAPRGNSRDKWLKEMRGKFNQKYTGVDDIERKYANRSEEDSIRL